MHIFPFPHMGKNCYAAKKKRELLEWYWTSKKNWSVHHETLKKTKKTRAYFRDCTKEWVLKVRHRKESSAKRDSLKLEEVSPFCCILQGIDSVCSAFFIFVPFSFGHFTCIFAWFSCLPYFWIPTATISFGP